MKRIEGCRHSVERMNEWIQEGACPICLTATLGVRNERIAARLRVIVFDPMNGLRNERIAEKVAEYVDELEAQKPSAFRDAIKKLDAEIGTEGEVTVIHALFIMNQTN